jgi:hypothetical protein
MSEDLNKRTAAFVLHICDKIGENAVHNHKTKTCCLCTYLFFGFM